MPCDYCYAEIQGISDQRVLMYRIVNCRHVKTRYDTVRWSRRHHSELWLVCRSYHELKSRSYSSSLLFPTCLVKRGLELRPECYTIQTCNGRRSRATTTTVLGFEAGGKSLMAAEEGRVVTALPPPPAYYKLFTPKAAVDKGEFVHLYCHSRGCILDIPFAVQCATVQ